jgi:hypothetical protein
LLLKEESQDGIWRMGVHIGARTMFGRRRRLVMRLITCFDADATLVGNLQIIDSDPRAPYQAKAYINIGEIDVAKPKRSLVWAATDDLARSLELIDTIKRQFKRGEEYIVAFERVIDARAAYDTRPGECLTVGLDGVLR